MIKQTNITCINEAVQRKQSIIRSLDSNIDVFNDTIINLMLTELFTLEKIIKELKQEDNNDDDER